MQYTVKAGDTLGIIARNLLGDSNRWESIAFASGLSNPDALEIGDVLDIPVDVDLKFTAEQLRPISKYITDEEREEITMLLNINLARWGIDEPLEIAHFLAQASHESAGFRCRIENLNYSEKSLLGVFGKYFDEIRAKQCARKPERIANIVYGGRMGNTMEGDGWLYRGRGYFQLTGYSNYAECASSIEIDIDRDPDMVYANRCIALLTSAWYWNRHRLGEYALNDDIKTITRKINGGYHGLESRKRRLNSIKEALGI